MVRLTRAGTFAALILAAVAAALLGSMAFAQSRNVVVGRPVPPSKSGKTLQRTWQNGPATTPPEVEMVPRRAAFPPVVHSSITGSVEQGRALPPARSAEAAEPGRQYAARGTPSPIRSVTPYGRASAKRVVATVGDSRTKPTPPDPVARARADLTCLRDDPKARQAFYDELRRTAERVHAGEPDLSNHQFSSE